MSSTNPKDPTATEPPLEAGGGGCSQSDELLGKPKPRKLPGYFDDLSDTLKEIHSTYPEAFEQMWEEMAGPWDVVADEKGNKRVDQHPAFKLETFRTLVEERDWELNKFRKQPRPPSASERSRDLALLRFRYPTLVRAWQKDLERAAGGMIADEELATATRMLNLREHVNAYIAGGGGCSAPGEGLMHPKPITCPSHIVELGEWAETLWQADPASFEEVWSGIQDAVRTEPIPGARPNMTRLEQEEVLTNHYQALIKYRRESKKP